MPSIPSVLPYFFFFFSCLVQPSSFSWYIPFCIIHLHYLNVTYMLSVLIETICVILGCCKVSFIVKTYTHPTTYYKRMYFLSCISDGWIWSRVYEMLCVWMLIWLQQHRSREREAERQRRVRNTAWKKRQQIQIEKTANAMYLTHSLVRVNEGKKWQRWNWKMGNGNYTRGRKWTHSLHSTAHPPYPNPSGGKKNVDDDDKVPYPKPCGKRKKSELYDKSQAYRSRILILMKNYYFHVFSYFFF